MAKKTPNPSREGASNNAVDVLEESDNNQKQPEQKAPEPKEPPLTEQEQELLDYLTKLKSIDGVNVSIYAKGTSFKKDGISACAVGILNDKTTRMRLEIHPDSPNKNVIVAYAHIGKDDFTKKSPSDAFKEFKEGVSSLEEVHKKDQNFDNNGRN